MDSILLENSPVHNPVLKLSDHNKQTRVLEELKDFRLPVSKLNKLMAMFREEMALGLDANPRRKSVFYMCNTFVTDFPDGTEEGDYLSMDLGGTNLRIYLIRLKQGTEPVFRSKTYEITEQYRKGKAQNMFDFLAVCIEDFINNNPDISGKRLPFGFTFSFGYDQKALDSGIINSFSFDTDLPDGIGKDAAECLRQSIDRKGLNVDVVALVNDTTSTLAFGMYLKPNTEIGFVLGTGTNTCYIENVDRIKKLDPLKTFGKPVKQVIINLENGMLGDDGSLDFIKTKWDIEIDSESSFPHEFSFEKIIGGIFMGEIVRRSLLSLAENNLFLGGILTEELKTKESIGAQDVSAVEADESDGAVIKLLNRLGYTSEQITSDDILIVKHICAILGVRNALICAADLSAVIQHIDKPLVRIAVDGSVYKKHPKMQTLINDFIHQLVPNHSFETFLADDGSGKGSAFIAAVASKHR